MKLKYYLYSFIASMLLMFSACTPEEFDLGKKTYAAEDLVEGLAFTVTPDAGDPNIIHLKSLVKGVTPLWETPQGRSQEATMDIQLPFAGDYEVTFGVITPAGAVYGEPYKFTVVANNFNMLSDEIWSNLAGGVGKTRKWMPVNGNYGIGRCTGPVMYLSNTDVRNDGSNSSDLMFGSANWTPNWDPGFQDWLIPASDPYMSSYMTFGLDAANGCTAEVFRNDANGGTKMNGKFSLNLSDPKRPTITFTDCYSLHNASFDAVCDNYTLNLKIIELTPYLLQIATMRTNSEGPWWLVWNFVSEEVIETNGECIPKEESGLIEKTDPVLPTFDNLLTDLFTTEINGVTYVGNQMTFNLDTEAPYDWLWWNGSPNVQKWESVTGGTYNNSWAPAAGDETADFELILSKASDGSYNYESGETSGKVTIADGVMTFDKEITILTASSDQRTVAVTGKEFTVFSIEGGEALVIGIPESVDENGKVNSYLVANLLYKKISTGPVGPTVVGIDNSLVGQEGITWIENGCIRIAFHHYGEGGKGLFKDAASVKLKKNQVISVTFKLSGGITWTNTPKCALIDNNIKQTWEPACFDLDDAVIVNTTGGETTVKLANTTGATVTFVPTCLDLSIQYDGYGTADVLTDSGSPDWSTVELEIVSCTIE